MSGLKVIALISGGKDSLFSILHCLANGHQIVALGNVYPETSTPSDGNRDSSSDASENPLDSDEDTNSHMYQTVGHNIIPLYASALELPLYRQPITGSALNTSISYQPTPTRAAETSSAADETEALLPLLQRIIQQHPHANALSTGAILSTYQRTRIESIALRLGLVPLAYLWEYPRLSPYTQSSLLNDMAAVGQESRIIKVASGGLDEGHLWLDLRDSRVVTRLGRDMARFGGGEVGAVLGEGGEFETLAVDGPGVLWKGRIEVDEGQRTVVTGEGGTAIVRVKEARVVPKAVKEGDWELEKLRLPPLWDDEFERVLAAVGKRHGNSQPSMTIDIGEAHQKSSIGPISMGHKTMGGHVLLSNLTATSNISAANQMQGINSHIRDTLHAADLSPSQIAFTTILLRSMSDFASVNKIYNELFTEPNPPARATVACGDCLPDGVQVMVSLVAHTCSPAERRGLHIQSRSYWAPANIGPYSQAIAVPLDSPGVEGERTEMVYVAGQIPLVPASMELLGRGFVEQAVLSLQHLWRIGRAMGVQWWSNVVVFIVAESGEEARERAVIAGSVWTAMHELSMDDSVGSDEDEDIGDRSLHRSWGASTAGDYDKTPREPLPDWGRAPSRESPPCLVVEVAELPKAVQVEWSAAGYINGATAVRHGYGEITTYVRIEDALNGIESSAASASSDVAELYIALSQGVDFSSSPPATIIPCKRVFDSHGNVYASAIRRRIGVMQAKV